MDNEKSSSINPNLPHVYGLLIDLDECGVLHLSVRDFNDAVIWSTTNGYELIEHGFMSNRDDFDGLLYHLTVSGVLPKGSEVWPMREFEEIVSRNDVTLLSDQRDALLTYLVDSAEPEIDELIRVVVNGAPASEIADALALCEDLIESATVTKVEAYIERMDSYLSLPGAKPLPTLNPEQCRSQWDGVAANGSSLGADDTEGRIAMHKVVTAALELKPYPGLDQRNFFDLFDHKEGQEKQWQNLDQLLHTAAKMVYAAEKGRALQALHEAKMSSPLTG